MATTGIEIREILPEDATEVAELSVQLGYPATEAEVRERIEATPRRVDHFARVASLQGQVVGWIEAEVARHLQSAPHTLITGLVVRDGVRSLGVGSRLCHEVEAWTRRQGLGTIRVTSRMTRERAHRFYLREGFVQTKTSAVFEKVLAE
jgi:GNAT superfamily N-acetyltransferase